MTSWNADKRATARGNQSTSQLSWRMSNELKIEAGKEYRRRDGKKWRCYATDGAPPWSCHGAVFIDGQWIGSDMSPDPQMSAVRGGDLIGPWTEPITMDWAALPRWIRETDGWIASDCNGDWNGFSGPTKPRQWPRQKTWERCNGQYAVFIPPAYAPKWTGDWRESLTKVPRT